MEQEIYKKYHELARTFVTLMKQGKEEEADKVKADIIEYEKFCKKFFNVII